MHECCSNVFLYIYDIKMAGTCTFKILGSLAVMTVTAARIAKNAIGFIGRIITLHKRHAFLCIFKSLISHFLQDMITRQQLFFSFPELQYSLIEFNSKKIC